MTYGDLSEAQKRYLVTQKLGDDKNKVKAEIEGLDLDADVVDGDKDILRNANIAAPLYTTLTNADLTDSEIGLLSGAGQDRVASFPANSPSRADVSAILKQPQAAIM